MSTECRVYLIYVNASVEIECSQERERKRERETKQLPSHLANRGKDGRASDRRQVAHFELAEDLLEDLSKRAGRRTFLMFASRSKRAKANFPRESSSEKRRKNCRARQWQTKQRRGQESKKGQR